MNIFFIGVVNNAITASILIVLVLLLRVLLKRAPRWIQPVLWGIVGIRLLCPFQIESALSLIPKANPIPENIEYMQMPQIDTGITILNQSINPIVAENFRPDPISSANPLQVWIYILVIVWLIGIAGMLLYGVVSYAVLLRKMKHAQLVEKNVYESKVAPGPFILGIVAPKIYLPKGLTEENRNCVLEHEKAHLKRRDNFWKPFGFLILSVYWFHPLCWIAYILLCKDIELACDEKVTKDKDNQWKAKYCQALLECSMPRKMITACPVAFGEGNVKGRVRLVLNYRKPAFWIVISSVVLCVLVAICFLTSRITKITIPGIEEFSRQTQEEIYSFAEQVGEKDLIKAWGNPLVAGNERLWPVELTGETKYIVAYVENGKMISLHKSVLLFVTIVEKKEGVSYCTVDFNGYTSDRSKLCVMPKEDIFGNVIECEVGDMMLFESNGIIMETYPAQLYNPYSVRKMGKINQAETEIKKKERIVVEPQSTPSVIISFELPEDWNYEVIQTDDEPTSSITVLLAPKSEKEGNLELKYISSGFVVCGTGLVQTEIDFNGVKAYQGVYYGRDLWSFITLEEPKGCAILNSAPWYEKYEAEIEQLLASVVFLRKMIGNIESIPVD